MAADNSKPWEDFSPVVKPSSSEQPDTKPWEDFGGETKPAPKGFVGHARDLGLSVLQGAIGVPEAAVGLADIPTGGAVGKALENEGGAFGFRPKQAREYLDTLKTDGTQQQKREFEQADGVIGKTAYALQNPSLVANAVAESLPMMGAGGVIGRGLVVAAPRLSSGVAAAAGEGITAAGSAAEQIRQETADGNLTPTQAGLAAATGVTTAGFGALGAKVAGRLGIADADTLMVQGAKGLTGEVAKQAAMKSIPRKVIEGAISEGFLEELPQSASEQILQNMALGKDWSEGVDSAVVLGVLSGMAMGGGAAGVQGVMQSPSQEAAPGQGADGGASPTDTAKPLALPAPTYTGTPEEQLRQAEAARAGGVAAADARAADLYQQRADFEASQQPARPGLEMMRQAYAEQLQALQGQEAGDPDVPQSAPPDGRAVLDAQAAQSQADRDAAIAASRSVASPDDEILQSIGATADPPHRAMGIDPAAGPLSAGAAIAVDTGAAGQMQAAAQAVQESPGQRWDGMSEDDRGGVARRTGLPPVVARNLPRAGWATLNPDLRTRISKAMAPTTPAAASSIEGADLGNGWAAFSPESGTAGVPRAEMPQIKAEHRGAMVNFMNARGVAHREETLPAGSLKPTQSEFSREKVERAKGFEGGNRAILVSADNHVLDGHHQWMAARERGEDVRAIRLNAPIRNLIGLAHDFPSSTKASGAAGPAESTGTSGRAADPAKIKPKSLVQLTRDAGGVSLDRKADVDQDGRTVGVFRRGGMDLDGLAELMQQHGFLTDADVTDTTSGAERAAELLRAALAGERVLSLNDVDAAMSQDAEAQYRDGIRQRAADYGIRTMFRPFGDIERDVMARDGDLAPEDQSAFEYGGDVAYTLEPLDDIDLRDARTLSEEEQMRMAGFSEDEINETINGTGFRESQGAPEQSQPGAAQESRNAGAQENQSQEGSPEGLTGYTNEDIARQEAAQRAAAAEAERTQREADQKAQADAERDSFTLTGSDRAADVQAAQGQGGLFDAPADAKPTSMKDGLTKIRKEKAAQAASESNQEPIKNEFRANAGPAAELAPGDQEPIKKNPSDPATPSEDALIATGLLRDRGDVWQYKFNVDGRWMTANVKSDAVDRATTTYLSAPESERITTKQRADRADAELIKRMDQTYGRMSISELEAQHDRLGGSISDLQRAGAREFNGNGRRRTSAAVSNEAARGAGEDRLHLGIYIKHRRDLIDQEAINTVEDLTDTGQPAVGNAPSPLEALFSDLNSESTRKANKAKKAAAKLPQAARIDYVQANFHDILMQMMDAGALEVNGAATLTEDNKSCL